MEEEEEHSVCGKGVIAGRKSIHELRFSNRICFHAVNVPRMEHAHYLPSDTTRASQPVKHPVEIYGRVPICALTNSPMGVSGCREPAASGDQITFRTPFMHSKSQASWISPRNELEGTPMQVQTAC